MIAGRARSRRIAIATEAAECRGARRSDDRALDRRERARRRPVRTWATSTAGIREYALARDLASGSTAEMRYRVNYSDLLGLLGRYREALAARRGGARARPRARRGAHLGSIMAQNMAVPLLERGEIDRVEEMLRARLHAGHAAGVPHVRDHDAGARARVARAVRRGCRARCASGFRRSRRPGPSSGRSGTTAS